MNYRSMRRREQDRADNERLILVTMFICLVGALYGLAGMEFSQRMVEQRRQLATHQAEEAAVIQARWEAKVRAKAWPGAQP